MYIILYIILGIILGIIVDAVNGDGWELELLVIFGAVPCRVVE